MPIYIVITTNRETGVSEVEEKLIENNICITTTRADVKIISTTCF